MADSRMYYCRWTKVFIELLTLLVSDEPGELESSLGMSVNEY